jgi:hypothetical protein
MQARDFVESRQRRGPRQVKVRTWRIRQGHFASFAETKRSFRHCMSPYELSYFDQSAPIAIAKILS